MLWQILFQAGLVLTLVKVIEFLHLDNTKGCLAQDFGHGSIVCVCNSTYCDEIGPVKKPSLGHYMVYTSTKDGLRFHAEKHSFQEESLPSYDVSIYLHMDEPLQTILGFGGAFSDAAGININSLSSNSKRHLMESYFSKKGIEYSLGRVPIGGTDFSTRAYTYDDNHDGDFDLEFFSLQPEDIDHKIPLILEANKLTNGKLKLVASPWSAPAWMKTNGKLHGFGFLKGEPGGQYYQTWANYILRFFQEYKANNINFWGLTAQNTPSSLVYGESEFNNMRFTAETQGKFISRHLGPTLAANDFGNVKIIVGDGVRLMFPQWTEDVLKSDANVTYYVAGTALHWYMNKRVPASRLTELHEKFPEKFILATEACEGVGVPPYALLGSWERAENYAYDIIEDLQHWTVGWIDWNIALDMNGGPNWSNNFVDSPIIVDEKNDQFYKQPMFFALGHFSKFFPPESVIIRTTISTNNEDISYVAAKTPENTTVLIILNRSEKSYNVIVRNMEADILTADVLTAELLPRSINTYVW